MICTIVLFETKKQSNPFLAARAAQCFAMYVLQTCFLLKHLGLFQLRQEVLISCNIRFRGRMQAGRILCGTCKEILLLILMLRKTSREFLKKYFGLQLINMQTCGAQEMYLQYSSNT